LHALSILRRVKSSDFTEIIYAHEPVVLNEIEEKEYIEILQEGMKAVARGRNGTAKKEFGDYPIRVAAKTGTVQVDAQDINNAVFVCYAPADKPEIAISVVVEKGVSGSTVMSIARRIFDYYFNVTSKVSVLATPYGELVP
jgi:penicillin-binding protein 2